MKVLLAIDGSPHSQAAIAAVTRRAKAERHGRRDTDCPSLADRGDDRRCVGTAGC